MSSRRNGMRKQVLKAKEGPLELRREEGKDNPPVREAEGKRKGSDRLPGGTSLLSPLS